MNRGVTLITSSHIPLAGIQSRQLQRRPGDITYLCAQEEEEMDLRSNSSVLHTSRSSISI